MEQNEGGDTPTPSPSPTGTPIVPAKYVPYVLAATTILGLVAAELALPGPWTPDRYFTIAASVLSVLVGGSLPGIRR